MKGFLFGVFCLIAGVGLNLPYLSWMNGYGWQWAYSPPLGWLGMGLNMMAIFFHEIGHTIPAWFYGYVTLPSFDFSDGGGMAWMMTEQTIPLLITINILLACGILYFKEYRVLQIVFGGLILFNLATAFTDFHNVIIDFAGPLAEILVASFFLTRAILDIAPRGAMERALNGVIGSGMMIKVYITAWGLLGNDAMRAHYYTQKNSHGFGDFDKIADRMGASFDSVVWVWLGLAILFTALPVLFALWQKIQNQNQSF
jgi:hypothetical protein